MKGLTQYIKAKLHYSERDSQEQREIRGAIASLEGIMRKHPMDVARAEIVKAYSGWKMDAVGVMTYRAYTNASQYLILALRYK